MKISIITPSFNQGNFLEQTIDSVLTQQSVDFEYIIIDGGSTDNSVKIIKQYEKYLSYWVSEPDRGQSHAINKGLNQAKGDVVNWLNSDDYLQPNALKIISEHFSDPLVNVVGGRSNIVKEGKIIRQSNGTDIYDDNLAKTLGWARIDQPETFFRKKVFELLGALNENLHFIMDKEFWTRYLICYGLDNIKTISDVLVNFRLHANSKTQSQAQNFHLEENALMCQIALTNKLLVHAQVIKHTLLAKNIALDQKASQYIMLPEKLPEQVLDYFLLYKADECYYNNDHIKCLQLLSSIETKNLSDVDLNLYEKLSFRSHFVPIFLKRLFKRWM